MLHAVLAAVVCVSAAAKKNAKMDTPDLSHWADMPGHRYVSHRAFKAPSATPTRPTEYAGKYVEAIRINDTHTYYELGRRWVSAEQNKSRDEFVFRYSPYNEDDTVGLEIISDGRKKTEYTASEDLSEFASLDCTYGPGHGVYTHDDALIFVETGMVIPDPDDEFITEALWGPRAVDTYYTYDEDGFALFIAFDNFGGEVVLENGMKGEDQYFRFYADMFEDEPDSDDFDIPESWDCHEQEEEQAQAGASEYVREALGFRSVFDKIRT